MRFFFFFSAVAVPAGLLSVAGALLLLGVAGVAGVTGLTVFESIPEVTTGAVV